MHDEFLLEEMPIMQKLKAAAFIGRIQPPHIGHYKVINEMVKTIRSYNKDNPTAKLETTPLIVIIRGKKSSKNLKRNPLDSETIIKIMKASGLIDSKAIFIEANSAFDAFKRIRTSGFEPILIFGGSDRGTKDESSYKDMLDKYFVDEDGNKIDHQFISFKRNDAAELNDEAQETLLNMIEKDGEIDAEIVSGTLARKAVKMGLHKAFASIVGLESKPEIAKIAFNKVLQGMENE